MGPACRREPLVVGSGLALRLDVAVELAATLDCILSRWLTTGISSGLVHRVGSGLALRLDVAVELAATLDCGMLCWLWFITKGTLCDGFEAGRCF